MVEHSKSRMSRHTSHVDVSVIGAHGAPNDEAAFNQLSKSTRVRNEMQNISMR
jgi:hypothetical protein